MSSEMRELVRAKIHEWRTDALEIRESDHAHRNLIAEEYEAHADELEAMLAKKPAPISGGAVITEAMVSAAYDHLCEAGVIEDAGTVADDMKVMRQALERALLARTEAGADGVSLWRYRFRNSETGGWHEWRYSEQEPVLNSLVADKIEIQGPFTTPRTPAGMRRF